MDKATYIGSRIEMLVDEELIENRENLMFRLNKPEQIGVAVTTDKPWEGSGSFCYGSVIEFEGKYFLYYRANKNESGEDTDPGQYVCLALSDDGIHWTKPELDLVPYGEYAKTNILMAGETSGVICHNFTPCIDTNPDCPTDERIKAVGGYAPDGLFVFVSADGIHFRKYSEKPAVTGALLDSQNVLLYDSERKMYRIYSRYFHTNPDEEGCGIRAIRSCESKDCVNWTEPVVNKYSNGSLQEHLYTNATISCPGAAHMLLSFPKRFAPGRAKAITQGEHAMSDAVFMSSRDGYLWDRRFMESWIGGGFDAKRWTQRNNMPARGLIEKDEYFHFLVGIHYCWDDAGFAQYRLRKYGFALLHAGAETGMFTTKPIVFEGSDLYLNYATAVTGGIRAAILDAETGEPFEGFALDDCEVLYGDSIEEKLAFKGGSLSALAGKAVKVQFELYIADLFAYRFA